MSRRAAPRPNKSVAVLLGAVVTVWVLLRGITVELSLLASSSTSIKLFEFGHRSCEWMFSSMDIFRGLATGVVADDTADVTACRIAGLREISRFCKSSLTRSDMFSEKHDSLVTGDSDRELLDMLNGLRQFPVPLLRSGSQ